MAESVRNERWAGTLAVLLVGVLAGGCSSGRGIGTPKVGERTGDRVIVWKSAKERPKWTWSVEYLQGSGWRYANGMVDRAVREDFARQDAEADAVQRLTMSVAQEAERLLRQEREGDWGRTTIEFQQLARAVMTGVEPVEWYAERYRLEGPRATRYYYQVWALVRMPEEAYEDAVRRTLDQARSRLR